MRRFGIVITVTVLFSFLAASNAHADTYWTGTTGDWNDPLNWDNGVPTSSLSAHIDNGGTAQISANTESERLYAGHDNSGAVGQTDGTYMVSICLFFGYYTGSSGTYNLSAGELSVRNERIGHDGTGEFNQSGGTHTVWYYMNLGYYSGSNGTYNLSAGKLSVGSNEFIGRYGTGEFNQDGGTHTVSSYLYLGYESDSSGTYNFTAGELSVGSREYIGYNGTGAFTQTGGIHNVGYIYVKGDSSYTLSGGTLAIKYSAELDGSFNCTSGDWTLNINGGLANFENGVFSDASAASFSSVAGTLTIFPTGFDPAAQFGSYNALGLVHNAGSTLVISAGESFAGRGWIGDHVQNSGNIVASGGSLDFRGGLTISDGGTLHSGDYDLTVDNGATVTIAASGGGISALSEYIGYESTGEFNQDGGTNTVGYLFVKNGSNYALSSGTLSIGNSAEVNGSFHFNNGDGELNINGGLVNFADAVIDGAGSASFNSVANTLTIFPTGFDPAAEFGSYNAVGLVHNAGSTLVISAGEGFAGHGQIDDPVECRGTIVAGDGPLVFNGNILILNGGMIDEKLYLLSVDNGVSVTIAASGGELSVGSAHIGGSGTGELNQDGGTHTISCSLSIGYESGSSGTYNLSAGELSVGGDERIGYSGTGVFNQTGGTHTVSESLYSSGTYNLSAGVLSVGSAYIGNYGTGEFNQTGGVHSTSNLLVGNKSGSSGTYNLGGTGELSVVSAYIGNYGTGEFNQTGGTHTVSSLYLGRYSGSSGTYNLSVGELSVGSEYIGYEGTGEFNQTGGTNSVRYLSINVASTYTFSSGTLIIKEGGSISGTIDFDHNAGLLSLLGGITDIQDAAFINAGSASFETAANSLTILPAGFDPETAFGSADLKGIFYTPGTTMIVYEGQSYTGHYNFNDPLEVRGTLIASGGMFGFENSLTISNGGTLDMSAFTLDFDSDYTVTIAASGGNLYTESVFLGNGDDNVFNQHQGVHTVTDTLYIGYQSSGTYNLTGGELHDGNVVIGRLATGEFNHNGGIHAVSNDLRLGNSSGSSGTYNLSAGELSVGYAYIGGSGTGEFNQEGGTHLVNGWLYLAINFMGSKGTYNLIDGALSCGGVRVGYVMGRGEFNQSGGTLSVSETLEITAPLGIYNLDGGTLEAHDVFLGGKGILNITNSDAYIEISGSFTMQDNAVLMAVPGTTIHMTGSDFENTSTSLNNLGGLQNTTFIFADSSDADTFEIASYDYGLIEENFYGNFGLEGLVLAGSYNGTLQLLDAHVNFTGLGPSTQSEALYVRTLVLGGNATLDLNGYNLYALEYTNYGGEVLNGEIQAMSTTIIPEPATIALISAGLLGLAGLARRKCRSIEV